MAVTVPTVLWQAPVTIQNDINREIAKQSPCFKLKGLKYEKICFFRIGYVLRDVRKPHKRCNSQDMRNQKREIGQKKERNSHSCRTD